MQTRRVEEHCDDVLILYPRFQVSERGRQRVLRERKKNVHAGVRGAPLFRLKPKSWKGWREVRYNPYEYKSFVFADTKEPVTQARQAYMTKGKVFVECLSTQ